MAKDGVKYGISYLPEDCMAYRDGYRYGAYKEDTRTGETHVTEFFETLEDVTAFVNENREYARQE